MRLVKLAIALAALTLEPVHAANWIADPHKSRIGFSGMQTGVPFQGSFGKWSAEIAFDPAHPESSHAKVTIDLSSASTGDGQRDRALPEPEWFAAKKYPEAIFETTRFIAKGAGAYDAPGRLTIRGVSKDVVLPFTLTIDGDAATAKGRLDLIRTDFGVGQGAWTSGQWVALEVGVDVDLKATKAGD